MKEKLFPVVHPDHIIVKIAVNTSTTSTLLLSRMIIAPK
jgi:hypothetical protein